MYHVMSRGIRKMAIFREDADYRMFLRILQKVMDDKPFILNGFCLMTNHFHLELTTEQTEIWKIMKAILEKYAVFFNQKYDFVGHLFEGRYTSCLIEDKAYFLEVNRYIHLNPVRAGIVKKPETYLYSSYGVYVGDACFHTPGKDLIDTQQVLEYFLPGPAADQEDPKNQYQLFVEDRISHGEQEERIRKDMKEDELWLPEDNLKGSSGQAPEKSGTG